MAYDLADPKVLDVIEIARSLTHWWAYLQGVADRRGQRLEDVSPGIWKAHTETVHTALVALLAAVDALRASDLTEVLDLLDQAAVMNNAFAPLSEMETWWAKRDALLARHGRGTAAENTKVDDAATVGS